ncbi:MAG: DUF1735 and LamG domain-containing protein [Tannerellaceae bacterium]|jgi:hypothetical protein|nr:DUF1735 and LamG domain-containing protein [Tannerellaceae bacterium]
MYRIKKIIAVFLCGGLFTACERDYNAELSVKNVIPHYVYISSDIETNVLATDIIDRGETEKSLQLTVKYAVTEEANASVEAILAPDMSLVEDYNKKKSKKFLPFPEANLSFTTGTVNIPVGSLETSVDFKIVNLDQLPNGEFLLPITIKSVNASNGFPVFEAKKTAYYQVVNKGAALKGQWLFDDESNPAKATVGKDLQPVGSGFTQVQGPEGKKGAVRISQGSYFKAVHEIAAGESGKVEEYTMLIDFKYPATGTWYTFYQTNLNNNDDADFFINKTGNIGVGDLGYSSAVAPANAWNRLIITLKKGVGIKFYLNGNMIHAPATNLDKDRFYLDPAGVILFGDEDGDDGEFDVARVDIYEGVMSEARIKVISGTGDSEPVDLSHITYNFSAPDFTAPAVSGAKPLEFENPASVTAVAGPGERGAALITKNNSVKVPNSKGTEMNTYTMLLDILPLGTDDDYAALFQATESNSGDDADLYIRNDGRLGQGNYGEAGAVPLNKWSRIVVVVDVAKNICDYYVNGSFYMHNPGRASHMTIGSSHYWLFADAYGHDYEYDIHCAGFSIWDKNLTEDEIAALGNADKPLQP